MSKAKVTPLPSARPLTPSERFNARKDQYLQAILAAAEPRPVPTESRLAAVEAKLDAVLDLLQKGAHQ